MGNIAALGILPDEHSIIMTVKTIRAHDPRWVGAFAREAARVRIALGPLPASIDHIGSTAVKDIVAKPVIDILIQVADLRSIDNRATRFEEIGYDARGEYGIAGRRYFSRAVGTGIVTGFHVHAFEQGSHQARRHIALRDCMRLRPDLAKAYSSLKRSIAGPDGQLPPDYAERKKSYVDLIADIAVLQSDMTPACESIARYDDPGADEGTFDMAYHEQWMQTLQRHKLRMGVVFG